MRPSYGSIIPCVVTSKYWGLQRIVAGGEGAYLGRVTYCDEPMAAMAQAFFNLICAARRVR